MTTAARKTTVKRAPDKKAAAKKAPAKKAAAKKTANKKRPVQKILNPEASVPKVSSSEALSTRARAERVVARCRELARISDVKGETTRTFLSAAMRRANALVSDWMTEGGLGLRMDAAGNLRGTLKAHRGEDGPRFVLGSHLDTVKKAGAFDGPLGVMVAIEAVETIGPGALPFVVEVIAFSEEEGVRFGVPFLGSRAVVGRLDEAALTLKDKKGLTVRQAIAGYGLDVGRLPEAELAAGTFGYLEVHLEQGPVLEREERPAAGVSAIAGQTRLKLRFDGQANHAGTTPMEMRRDALVAAAEWIVTVDAFALAEDGLVATVGALQVEPGLGNTVPGRVTVSLDVRHARDGVRVAGAMKLLERARESGRRREVTVSHEVVLDQTAVAMDGKMTWLLGQAALECGYVGLPMVSGAGHDAMIVAERVPAAMLFVRTPGGISHHPDEAVRVEDVEAALRTTVEFLRRLDVPGGGNA